MQPRVRITRDDVHGLRQAGAPCSSKRCIALRGGGAGIPAVPTIDFSKFGETETAPNCRVSRSSRRATLHRSWLNVPHVTQFEEADVTELEEFRKSEKERAKSQGIRLTPLAFILKAVVAALREFPQFNASLDATGENLILKKYFHIGVAVDTPGGLVVPVVRDCDRKGVLDIAIELGELSARAREGKLRPADIQGACFSVSSLGGIGGTHFTPIVNAPEVAILGVGRMEMKPVFQSGEFVPRRMLPIALSYDHRVIDGAEGARFVVYLRDALADMRRVLL